MKEASWVPAALTAVSGCTGYAAMCWALGFLTPLEDPELPSAFRKVIAVLLIHEAWVTFQHANVLLNPFCQRLDRRYGVAMLRKGQHWVIASVLVMYWSREVASMLLCLPYLSLYAQETARALFDASQLPVFVTGASSKVGSAVVLSLLQHGFRVLAHSSDSGRSQKLLAKCKKCFAPEIAERLRVTTSLVDGVHVRHWVVGKSEEKVLNYVPYGAKAVVFSVPNPFEGRRDDVVVEIYACHAAGIVAAANPNWLDELGDVRLEDMAVQWKAALKMGFSLPEIPRELEQKSRRSPSSPGVIVVGAGPSGLAAAAALVRKGEDVVVLERQGSIQGGWCQHFEGLTITTRAATCGLPGFPVKFFTSADELKGTEYVEYLAAYAARFALDVRCNMEVVKIQEVDGRWHVSVKHLDGQSTLTCEELVVATGKNAVPRVPQCYDRADLRDRVIHSSQLQGHRLQEAVAAAAEGRLLVVGFGNSAADICSLILGRGAGSVHVSMRRLPPIVRRQWGPLRLEWFARLFSLACDKNGDRLTNWLMYMIEGDMRKLFPDLDTWGARKERHIPTVDRDGSLLRHVREQRIVPHQDIERIECRDTNDHLESKAQAVQVKFAGESEVYAFDLVILCTGYKSSLQAQSVVSTDEVMCRAHFVGLGPEPKDLLPLAGIGREAQRVATQISDLMQLKRRRERSRECNQDGVVRIWRPAEPKIDAELVGHLDHAVAWSPDGMWLASAGLDASLRVWNVGTSQHPCPNWEPVWARPGGNMLSMDPLNITEDLAEPPLKVLQHPSACQEPFVNFAESLSSADLADIGCGNMAMIMTRSVSLSETG
eukprot:Skav235534  [mRNA]  locus=scaffold3067:82632:94797:+ [translate_table: standard]